jgi:hypothetical protein
MTLRTRHPVRQKVANPFAPLDSMSVRNEERKDLVSSKLKERSGNVYENKWSAFHRPGQSGNAIENKGSYALKAGMSLKLKVVSRW